jgi:CheY-like chemotaxis protein
VAGLNGSAVRILVVDDHPDTLATMVLLLRQIGHEVHAAASGAEALEIAPQMKPQMVLMDIAMPHLDGWQLAPMLREALGQSVVLVAVSGQADADASMRSRKAGFDAYVPKPIDMSLLHSILNQMRDTR